MELLRLDLRNAAAALRRHPALSLLVLLTLTIGIGANTAVFSVVNGLLLRPLPYPEAHQLVSVWTRYEREGEPPIERFRVSAPEFFDYAARSEHFTAMAAYHTTLATLTGDGAGAVRVRACRSTSGLVEVLRPPMALGRTFRPGEDLPGGEPIVVLGHDLWRGRYGGDPDLVGRSILIDEVPTRVIGVLAAGFEFPAEAAELWVPLPLDPADTDRRNHNWVVTGRLSPGATLAGARSELDVLMEGWRSQDPAHYRGHELSLRSLHEDLTGSFRPALRVLTIAVLFVLLLVGANVVNLLLVRAEERLAEFGIRAALGASRRQVFRQLFAEVSLLGAAAAVLGTGVALVAVRWLEWPGARQPGLQMAGLDLRVPVFGLAAGLVVALVCAAIVGARLSPDRLAERLTLSERGSSGGRSWSKVRSGFVVAQMALSLLLLVGTAVAAERFWQLTRTEPGFETDGIVTGNLWLNSRRYEEPAAALAFLERSLAAIAGRGGLDAVLTSRLPMSGFPPRDRFTVAGDGEAEPRPAGAGIVLVTPGFFELLEIPMLQGRNFTPSDRPGSEPVVILNRGLAQSLWPDQNPVGYRVRSGERPWMRVVGVVADFHYQSLREPPGPVFFVPAAQAFETVGRSTHFVHALVRSNKSSPEVVQQVRSVLAELDPDTPFSEIKTLESYLGDSLATDRALTLLMSTFSTVGMLLSLSGICGVLLFFMASRQREIGLRMAMGAGRGQITRMILKRGLVLASLGLAGGAVAAILLEPTLAGGLDPSSTRALWLPVAALALLLVSALVCWLPALRAARVEPARALRD